MGTQKLFRNTFNVGTLQVNGTLTASSDMTITGALTQTGTITASSGFAVAVNTITSGSTGTTVPAYGLTVINGTGGGKRNYSLGAPVAGYQKTIVAGADMPSSTAPQQILTSVAVITTGSSGIRKLKFKQQGETATLIAQSASVWSLVQKSTGVVVAASTTTT
jgi:hypothetical protein